MTNLQKLTTLIVEAVPEIMELKFGCRIYNSEKGIQVINDERGTGNGSVKVFYTKCSVFYSDTFKDNKIKQNTTNDIWWDILGRDINLEDCLVAWNKKLLEFWGDGICLKKAGMNPQLEDIIINWLPNTPLSDQSEDTINKLLTLLS